MSKGEQLGGPVAVSEAAPAVLGAVHQALDYAAGDVFDETPTGEFTAPNGEHCVIRRSGEKSAPGEMGEYYGYVAVDIAKQGGKPVRVGVLSNANNSKGLKLVEFTRGKKQWEFGSDEEPPKFVGKTLGRLGLGHLV